MDKQYRARRPPGQPSTGPQRQLRSTRRNNNSTLPGATTEIANQHGEDMRKQDTMGIHGASVSATPQEHYSSPYSTPSANYPQLPSALPQPNAHQGEVMMEQFAGPSHGYNAPIILQSQYRQLGPSPLSGHHTVSALPGFDNYVGRQMMNLAAHPHNGVSAPRNYHQQLRPGPLSGQATVSTVPRFDNYAGREMMNMVASPHNGASAPQNYHQQLRPGPPINKTIPSAFTEFDTYGEEEMMRSDAELMKPQGTVPPPLPPSVEEAYRRKCIQLKQRMSEVEESNDASRSRLVRIQRAIEKMRLERAFLLEQLAKRTSTNVEDSEGSPSPPPTPKEKPLRTKRGHRKPSFMADLGDGRAGSTFIPQGPVTMSPSSDAFSHTHPEGSVPAAVRRAPSATNGVNHGAPKRPRTPFEFFVAEEKARHMADPVLRKEVESGAVNIENMVSNSWPNMSEDLRARWQAAFEEKKKQWDQEKEGTPQHAANIAKPVQEDVEMADDAGSHSGGDGLGFTAVNRS